MPGFFITFEGGEGSGKTSQIARLAATLRTDGHAVTTTREPGGSPGADALRHVILSGAAEALGPEMEAILFAAARADHVATTIAPALARGEIVVSDRFLDSTRVYQGLDPAVGPELVASLERAVLSGIYPDLTIVLDVDAETGLHRAAERRGAAAADRFERETLALHEARRQGFLDIAKREPERCVVVDGRRNWMAVAADIAAIVDDRMQAVRLETLGRDISGADAAAGAARRALP